MPREYWLYYAPEAPGSDEGEVLWVEVIEANDRAQAVERAQQRLKEREGRDSYVTQMRFLRDPATKAVLAIVRRPPKDEIEREVTRALYISK